MYLLIDGKGTWVPSQYKNRLPQVLGFTFFKIRRSRDRLFFKMGISMLARHRYIETPPVFSAKDVIYLEQKQKLRQEKDTLEIQMLCLNLNPVKNLSALCIQVKWVEPSSMTYIHEYQYQVRNAYYSPHHPTWFIFHAVMISIKNWWHI